MSDTTLNRFLAQGTNAERLAFVPDPATPASGPDPGYIWWETDTGDTYAWDIVGAAWVLLIASSPGTVTSVGLAMPSIFDVSGSPVTGAGTLTAALANQNANLIFAGPSTGAAAAPTFRSLVAADVPTLNQNTTGSAATLSAVLAASLGGLGIDSSALTGFGYVAAGTWSAKTAIQANVLLNVAAAAIGALDIDWATATTFSKTLAANSTFTFSNAVDGETRIVALTNTASNYTVTWPTVQWSGGTPPVQTVGAKTDVYTFVKVGSVIYGSVVQNFS